MSHACARRRDALLERAGEVDAVLVTRLPNVRYLTGFTGSNAALLVTPERAVLATDGRYRLQAAQQAPDVELLVDREVACALADRAARDGVRRLAFEAHDVTVELHGQLLSAAPGLDLLPLGRAVEELRQVKDGEELAALARACGITAEAFRGLLDLVHPGRTERDLARFLEARMFDLGAEGPAFPTIVATGPHSAIPHHAPTDRPLAVGDLLIVDFGARYAGYHADMTRTVAVGHCADWQRDLHGLVAAAQLAALRALAPGADVTDVDRAARAVVEAAGRGEEFPHGVGHGVGLEIHEAPRISPTGAGRLAARVPVTVEPGVYLAGRGGVRIEDTVVVRDGEPELLTTAPKELLVLA
ncbi:MAG TPA: Xaa-Pro peptidase family protein [Mycobacteriales bacterium]|nr:Xaa-Pro peptidase family protein [Mycobacteriales bacterium]